MGFLSQNIVKTFTKGNFVSYVFNEQLEFDDTSFNILQNEKFTNLCEIVKSYQNGKIKLNFYSSDCVSINLYLSALGLKDLKCILNAYAELIKAIASNSLLNCGYCIPHVDTVFYNSTTGLVQFICLPVKNTQNLTVEVINAHVVNFCLELQRACPNLVPYTHAIIQYLQADVKNLAQLQSFMESPDFLEAKMPDLENVSEEISNQVPVSQASQVPDECSFNNQNINNPSFEEPEQLIEGVNNSQENYQGQSMQFNRVTQDTKEFDSASTPVEEYINDDTVVSDVGNDKPIFIITGNGKYSYISFEINGEEKIIGRSQKSADFIIGDHPKLSRNHCSVQVQNGGLVLTDLNSANGTFVNGKRLLSGEAVFLNENDSFSISDIQLFITRKN